MAFRRGKGKRRGRKGRQKRKKSLVHMVTLTLRLSPKEKKSKLRM